MRNGVRPQDEPLDVLLYAFVRSALGLWLGSAALGPAAPFGPSVVLGFSVALGSAVPFGPPAFCGIKSYGGILASHGNFLKRFLSPKWRPGPNGTFLARTSPSPSPSIR